MIPRARTRYGTFFVVSRAGMIVVAPPDEALTWTWSFPEGGRRSMVTTYPLPTLLVFRTVQLVSAGGLAHTLASARPCACPVVILVDAQALNRTVDAPIGGVASGRTAVGAIGRPVFSCCVSQELARQSRRKCRSIFWPGTPDAPGRREPICPRLHTSLATA